MIADEYLGRSWLFARLKSGPHGQLVERYDYALGSVERLLYLARHVRPVRGAGAKAIDVYVIDEATRERALNLLVNISTADTAFLMAMIIGAVVSLVVWSSGLIVAIAAVLVFAARFALGRWSRTRIVGPDHERHLDAGRAMAG